MSTQSIKAGEAWWAITARDEATKVLDRVSERLKSIGARAAMVGASAIALGTAISAPMLAAAKSFSDYVDGLNDTRVQTGLAVESLSQLAFVASQQGTSLDGLKKGLVGMAKFTTQVATGGKGAIKVLDALGISTDAFLAMTPEQRFKVLAEQISKIEDPSIRAGVAMKVFGKAGNEMLPMLALGAKGIEEMQRRAAELGLTVSQADAEKFGAFGDELAAIGEQATRAWYGLGAVLIEQLSPFIPLIQESMRNLIEFIDNNRDLVAVVLAGAAALIVFGVALTVVGGTLVAVGAIAASLSAIIGFVSTACTVAASAFAFLLSPIGLVALAIAGVAIVIAAAVVAWVQLTESGQRAASAVSAAFVEAFAVVRQVLGGIFDALAAGDWALAAEIGFAAVGLVWAVVVAGMSDAWFGFVGLMGSALIAQLQFVDGAIRTVLNGLIAAYNWVAEQMGWTTAEAIASGSEMLARMQNGLKQFVDKKSAENWGEVNRVRGELDALTKRAADAREARRKSLDVAPTDTAGLGQPDIDALKAAGAGGKSSGGGGVLGTFNAAVAGMLNSSMPDHLENIAANTAETNEKLDEVKDKLDAVVLQWE